MNIENDIIYVAYKKMIETNIHTGFFNQHVSEADFYAFNKYENLFLFVLEETHKKHSNRTFLSEFYKLNPDRIKDLDLAKKILKISPDETTLKEITSHFSSKPFENEFDIVKPLILNLKEEIYKFGFNSVKVNEEFRNKLYDLDNFSLSWFDLPSPKNNEILKNILKKDYISYLSLNTEQQHNKYLSLITLQSLKNETNKYNASLFYESFPLIIKVDKDFSNTASKIGFTNQPIEALEDLDNLTILINKIFKEGNQTSYSNNKHTLTNVLSLFEKNPQLLQKNNVVEFYFNWLNDNKIKLDLTVDEYHSHYKILKIISKFHPIFKEKMKEPNTWHLGNIQESKYLEKRTIVNYFNNTIPLINGQIKQYILYKNMSENLEHKTNVQSKFKI